MDKSQFWRRLVSPKSIRVIENILMNHPCHIQINAGRKRKLGDYRFLPNQTDIISINGNLSESLFTLVLLHELAHKVIRDQFGNKVLAHGIEWKRCFFNLVEEVVKLDVFPQELVKLLPKQPSQWKANFANQKELYLYFFPPKEGKVVLEDLSYGETFYMDNGKKFIKDSQLRKYYLCIEKETLKKYRVHPQAEVQRIV